MIKFILKFIKTERLWQEILERENFGIVDKIESTSVWQEVFSRVPFLKDWLKKREVMLLKNIILENRSVEFIRGQLAENKLYQSFDIPSETIPKVEEKEIKELPQKDKFIEGWLKKNADTSKETMVKK